jgi:hypothetical protein
MDSWIVALYLFLFLAYTIAMAPPEHQDILEKAALEFFGAIVYGDDHAYNKTKDPLVAKYFSGANFVIFMKTFFDVEVRNMLDGICFLSTAAHGQLLTRGLTFLKHQAVANPCKRPGQCKYLPYRESREYFVRVAWGRENKVRTLFDVVLSTLGHAYGTYASNYDAWVGLRYIYMHAMAKLGVASSSSLRDIIENLPSDDIKDFRRKGISREELLTGFPTWRTLENKNTLDPAYHEKMLGNVFAEPEGVW